MPPSSFSRQQRLTALAGALATALASWLYFGYAGKGVVVSGAGDSAANGYYQWERRQKVYVKAAAGPEGAWRVPNVYDLVSRSPQYRADGEGPVYFMAARDDQKKQRRVWFLSRSGFAVYSTGTAVVEIGDNTPPSSGWVSVMKGDTKEDTINPPPQVDSCGKRVRPDDDIQQRYRGRRGSSSAFALGSGPAEVVKYPVTVLFVLVNLLIAYHLWAKRVSPDAVAISYALFWEEREYWRLVTASFSHFEPLHLLFNAMSTWNTRETERLLGSFRHLYLSLDLVVTTIMLVMVIKHFLIKWGMENHRQGKAVGFSCVIFAYMTYLAVAMREFCPMGQSFSTLCFKTWSIPMPGGLPPLPVNLGPFGSLALAQIIMPRAAFLGHLAGIFMGYLMSWGMLGRLSTPLLAGASVVLMMQHSKCWARNMPDFSLLLQGWAGGDVGRVSRARRLNTVFAAHVCLTAAFLFLFTWGTGVAELMSLVVGFNAVQALKCCCCPDSVPAEHRFCINLLKAYGTLNAVLLVSDLISFGAILSQVCFLESSGLSGTSLKWGMGLLVLASAVHLSALAGCVEGIVIFRDGQAFLSSIGLGKVVTTYALRNTGSSSSGGAGGGATASTSSSTMALPYAAAGAITAGRYYRGGGRALGTVASNRSTTQPSVASNRLTQATPSNRLSQPSVASNRLSQSGVGRGSGGRAAAAAAAMNRALPGYLGRGRGSAGEEEEEGDGGEDGGVGMPLMGNRAGGGGRANAPRQTEL